MNIAIIAAFLPAQAVGESSLIWYGVAYVVILIVYLCTCAWTYIHVSPSISAMWFGGENVSKLKPFQCIY